MRHLAANEFRRSIAPKLASGMESAEVFVDRMAHLISVLLHRATENSHGAYSKLAGKLFPPNKPLDIEASRVITFNYDTLLDGHLLGVGRYSPQRVYFDRIQDQVGVGVRRVTAYPNPLLVKLHGSLNWRVQTDILKACVSWQGEDANFFNGIDGASVDHGRVWIDEIVIDGNRPHIDDNLSPLIIPPLPSKPVTKIAIFHFLWTKALEYLYECEELIVCGYSLPPTDQLAMSLFSSFKNPNLKSVTVIDPNAAILNRWRELLIRKGVGRIGDDRIRWEYFADFSEWVESM